MGLINRNKTLTLAVVLLLGCNEAFSDPQNSAIASALGQNSTGTNPNNQQPQSNPNNTNGGMVYSNVSYNSQAPLPKNNLVLVGNNGQPQNPNNTNICNPNATQSSSANNNSKPKKKIKKPIHHKTNSKPKVNSWAYQRFDVDFNDDVSKLPSYLAQFDPELTILPPLGKKISEHIILSMQQASISDIISAVDEATSSAVKIIYNQNQDSIRLSYQSMIDYGTDAMQQSIAWQNGKGKPKPIEGPDGKVLYPYGQYSPTIICKQLQVCDIQFDINEKILDANIGDTTRWAVTGALSGLGTNQTQHIILKPMYNNLTTNLVVTTDKNRTYSITLKSSDIGYIAIAGFYYPQQMNSELDNRLNRLKSELGQQDSYQKSNVPLAGASTGKGTNKSDDDELPALKIQRNYKVTVERGNPIWKPLDVFNDGERTYIRVSPDFVHSDKDPILMGVDENGQTLVMNYTVRGNYFIATVIFDRAVMIDNINDKSDTVYITRGDTPPTKNWLF